MKSGNAFASKVSAIQSTLVGGGSGVLCAGFERRGKIAASRFLAAQSSVGRS